MTLVAAIQLNSGPELHSNLGAAAAYLQEAATEGAKLALLPENFSLMAKQEREKLAHAEVPGDGPVQSFLARHARDLGIWIVGGTIPLRGTKTGHFFNSSLVFDSHGVLVARYDKIHLFDIDLAGRESYRESAFVQPGTHPAMAKTPAGTVGLSVCYDLRFPALYTYYSDHGAELFTVPAAFTATTGRAHWEALLQARAIENLAYVLAPAQTGSHPGGRKTWGHSMIIDPWGEVLARKSSGAGVIFAEVDKQKARDLRRQLPVIEHRRRVLFAGRPPNEGL